MGKKGLEYYMNLPYTITLQRGSGDGEEYWVARVLELPHCMTHGATREEALRDIEDAKKEWLKSNLEDGLPIPEPRKYAGQFHLRMAPSLHESLSRMAELDGISLNQYIVMVLSHAVGKAEVNKSKFDDIKAIMKDGGPVWMSIGKGYSKSRSVDAAKAALTSPLLDASIKGAKGVLFNIIGSSDLTLFEVNQAAEVIKAAVDPDANISFFVSNEAKSDNEVTITLFASAFYANIEKNALRLEEDNIKTMLKKTNSMKELDLSKLQVPNS
ncbi:MAG: hypothetical protein A2137_03175 [Chloroflexi bacterium RBG_16_58_8]|nr:MAG: hypothetical protein A2137_03175 [Chloroflexi bacterium RBG_16_58_8]